MIDKEDLDITKNNAIIVSVFMILIMGVFLIIGSVGIPFIGDSPETLSADDAVTISETDDQVILSLTNEARSENIEIIVGDDVYNWNADNQIKLNKAELYDNIEINSYTDGNIYDTYVYNSQADSVNIVSNEDTILKGNEYNFELTSQSSNRNDYESIIWSIDDEFVQRDTPTIRHEFDNAGTHTIMVELTIDNVDFTSEKEIRVVEPGEVVLDASVDKTNVTILEELSFNVTEVSDENAGSYRWNLGDDNTKFGQEIGHWYQEPGTYNVTVTGDAEDTTATGEDTITINVSELEEDVEQHQLTVNVFDAEENERLTESDVTISNSITENTGEAGQVQFTVQEGDHDILAEKEGYDFEVIQETVTDNIVVDMRLSPSEDEEDTGEEDTGEEDTSEDELSDENEEDTDEEEDVAFEQEEPTQTSAEAPSRYEQILDSMDGNGTTDNPYIITRVSELQSIQAEPTSSYRLGQDINAARTQLWNFVGDVDDENLGLIDDSEYNTNYSPIVPDSEQITINDETLDSEEYIINYTSGEIMISESVINRFSERDNIYIDYETDNVYRGFTPIDSDNFAPEIDGDGHIISNLYINRPTSDNVGIFEKFEGGAVYDLTIGGHYVRGYDRVGGLAGEIDGGIVEDVTIGGTIEGNNRVGGLVGQTSGTDIDNVRTLLSMTGENNIGGLAGLSDEEATIQNVSINTAEEENITGQDNIGGIVGNSITTNITTSYSLAVINGHENVGGLVGVQNQGSEITNSYSASRIAADSEQSRGSLIGVNDGEMYNSYWDTVRTNQDSATGSSSNTAEDDTIIGLETNKMQGTRAWNEMTLFDFQTSWDVTPEYPDIHSTVEQEYDEDIDNLIIESIDEEDNTELIEVGDEISDTPRYTNTFDEEITVNIRESGVEVHSFDILSPSDVDEERHMVTPITESHPNNEHSRLEGYKFDEENMEINVLYTELDLNRNPVEYETYPFIVEITNEEDVNPEIEINDQVKTGQFEKFELIPGDYELTIDKLGYENQTRQITMTDEPKSIQTEFEELPNVDLSVDISRESEVIFNGDTRTGDSFVFEDVRINEYMIEVIPGGDLDGSIKQIISLTEDKSLEYSFDNELLTVIIENEDGNPINSDVMIQDMTRVDSSHTHFGKLEPGTYDMTIESQGYETRTIEVDIIENEHETITVQLSEEEHDE